MVSDSNEYRENQEKTSIKKYLIRYEVKSIKQENICIDQYEV